MLLKRVIALKGSTKTSSSSMASQKLAVLMSDS